MSGSPIRCHLGHRNERPISGVGRYLMVVTVQYFASGIFSDAEQVLLLQVFTEMEVAAQYVYSTNLLISNHSLLC